MQLLETFTFRDKEARVYDFHDGDYIVQFYAKGVHMDNSDYVTDDLEDARSTASWAVQDEKEWNEANNLVH